ncbi:hypothetical protein [Methanobrevibacter sp.]
MELYKFCIFLLLLVLLSLGFVSASGESDVFEPINDSFVDNCSDFVFDEDSSYYISDDGFNDSLHDLKDDSLDDDFNDSLHDLKDDDWVLNSTLEGRGGGDSQLSLIQTTITAYDLEMYYRDGSVIYATLKDSSNNPIVNKTVVYILAGHNYTRVTNSIGRVAMGIYARPGNYTVEITFQETGYVSSSKTVHVAVHEIPTTLLANDLQLYYRDGSAISATLKDINGNPIANKTIILNLNGHVYTRITNIMGELVLEFMHDRETILSI